MPRLYTIKFDHTTPKVTHKLKKKGSWNKFRAATLNILSAKDDIYIEQAALAMCRHSIAVLVIQEARRTTDDRTVEVFLEDKKYTFRLITSGNAINNTHGVGFLIRQDKDILIKEIKAESERILSIDVSLKGYDTKLICAYAPTAVDDDVKIDEFYKILKGSITTRTQNQKYMILGDFNAYPEFSKKHSCV